jgi:hypothetical protein
MHVTSKRHVSQVQKDALITKEDNIFHFPIVNLFGAEIHVDEMRQASKISLLIDPLCCLVTQDTKAKAPRHSV